MANVTVRRGGSGDCGGTDGEGKGEGGSDEAGGGVAAPALGGGESRSTKYKLAS
jgi:hypothetical protein